MRVIAIISLLLPLFLCAQRNEYTQSFNRETPAGLGKEIRLPDEPADLSKVANHYVTRRIHIITTQEDYRSAFPLYRYTRDSIEKYKRDDWTIRWMVKHLVDSLPVIDFSRQELVIFSGCGQCMTYCDWNRGHHSCHRNACGIMYKAFLRDKKHDLSQVKGPGRIFLDALYGKPPERNGSTRGVIR